MKNTIARSIGLYLNTLAHVAPRKAGKASFNIFCHPFREKMPAKQLQFLHSAEAITIAHKDETIRAYRWGKGEKTVLFLHGWQSHTYRWKKYIESFDKEQYTIYAFDAPGHGLSSGKFLNVPLYSEVIEKMILHIGKVDVIITHSLGGFSALYTFHHKPALRPGRLITMAPPGEAQEFFEFFQRALNLSEKTIALTTDRFRELFSQGPDYFSAPRFAGNLDIPGFIIHDEDDRETNAENSRRIHQQWKNSELLVTKGLGHSLKSETLLRLVLDFAAGKSPEKVQTAAEISELHSHEVQN